MKVQIPLDYSSYQTMPGSLTPSTMTVLLAEQWISKHGHIVAHDRACNDHSLFVFWTARCQVAINTGNLIPEK